MIPALIGAGLTALAIPGVVEQGMDLLDETTDLDTRGRKKRAGKLARFQAQSLLDEEMDRQGELGQEQLLNEMLGAYKQMSGGVPRLPIDDVMEQAGLEKALASQRETLGRISQTDGEPSFEQLAMTMGY